MDTEELIEEKNNRSTNIFLEIIITVFLALVFLFFLIKGILWLIVPAIVAYLALK